MDYILGYLDIIFFFKDKKNQMKLKTSLSMINLTVSKRRCSYNCKRRWHKNIMNLFGVINLTCHTILSSSESHIYNTYRHCSRKPFPTTPRREKHTHCSGDFLHNKATYFKLDLMPTTVNQNFLSGLIHTGFFDNCNGIIGEAMFISLEKTPQ